MGISLNFDTGIIENTKKDLIPINEVESNLESMIQNFAKKYSINDQINIHDYIFDLIIKREKELTNKILKLIDYFFELKKYYECKKRHSEYSIPKKKTFLSIPNKNSLIKLLNY